MAGGAVATVGVEGPAGQLGTTRAVAFTTRPDFRQAVQTSIRRRVPAIIVLTLFRLGLKRRMFFRRVRRPTPPCFFGIPLWVYVRPAMGRFPQSSHIGAITHLP